MSQRLVIADIPVEIRRSRRRRTRFGLTFDPRGHVIVEAPSNAAVAEIQTVVTEHQRWMKNQLLKAREEAGFLHPLSYDDGALVHYLGDSYRLEVRRGKCSRVTQRSATAVQLPLLASTPTISGSFRVEVARHDSVVAVLRDWYTRQADLVLDQRLTRYGDLPWLGGRLPAWRHRYMKSQWGSCSASGKISLNTHLTKVPMRLVDYVVLHELCHLKHLNHGRRFHGLMGKHMADWEGRRSELNRYAPVLYQDD